MRHATAPSSGKIASIASVFQEGGGREPGLGGRKEGVGQGRKEGVGQGRKEGVGQGASTRHSFPGTYRTPAPTGLGGGEKKVRGLFLLLIQLLVLIHFLLLNKKSL